MPLLTVAQLSLGGPLVALFLYGAFVLRPEPLTQVASSAQRPHQCREREHDDHRHDDDGYQRIG